MSGNRMHIAVVDDERDIRETVAEYLTLHGFRVTPVSGGEELRRLLENSRIDLVVLDISMPGEDGLSLARFLRVQHTAGIIMLTASGETVDRIVGLETGADDYLAKPVDLRELLARIKAVLRRAGRDPHDPRAVEPVQANRIVRFGRCNLDLDAHKLIDDAGEEVAMTAMEFDLLKAFAEHPNRVLSRDMLLDLAHNRDWEPFDRSIDIRIARLRRKIEKDPGKPETLRTVRGAGYMFVGQA